MASSPNLLLIMATIAVFGLIMVARPCGAVNALISGTSLFINRSLIADKYSLTMQPDCNLVLYHNGIAINSTHTAGYAVRCRLTLNSNGNLVIYDGANNVIKIIRRINDKGTGYALVLRQNGHLVIYGSQAWPIKFETHMGVTVGPHNAIASVDAVAEQVIISAADAVMVK